ncbi:MAG: UbiA family prenyltransferase [Candidatus Moranbacteria bacterium]|nr:UbiA family prenyltransferase [Candidatus Moranbacteria bacterium]
MLQMIQKILQKIENYPLTLTGWLTAFSAIIVLRMIGENLLSGFADKPLTLFIGSTLAAYLFFVFSYLIVLLFLSFWLKESIKRVVNVLLWGFLLAIFPPIIDKIWCGQNFCWSFYAFDSLKGLGLRFLSFFGNNAAIGITYGVRVEVALAIIFVMIYAYIKQKKAIRAFLAGIFTYAILFFLGSFPSWLAYLYFLPKKSIFSVESFDIAGLFLNPASYFSIVETDFMNALNVKMNLIYAYLIFWVILLLFFKHFRGKFWPVMKNVRWVQIFVHGGLILTGAGLGAFYFPGNMVINGFSFFALSNLILAAIFAWLASVFLNDQVDLEIDKMTNKQRPLATGEVTGEDYRQLFWICFVFSLILAITVGVKFFLVIFAYQAIGWIYSAWPFRLKRFPFVASFLSAFALALLFSSGFLLLADGQNISRFPHQVFWLLIVAFMVSLPIKDLKDIEGDRANGVWTIPVLFGEVWARFAIGLGIFLSYALSVIWINAKILFLPAMIFGALSFWILQTKKIPPRRVHIFVFGFLFLYVLAMFWLLFWPAVKAGL